MRPINFGASKHAKPAADDGVGETRGTGRGRGRDGAGEYEMANMNDGDDNV